MALPLPVLDDRTFEEMVAEALRLAPQRAPAWTDHNLSDPGVTLVELFAWLTEMQRFHLDRLRTESLVKLLELLGMQPRPAAPARASVAVSAPQQNFLPRGIPLRLGSIAFSTAESVTVVPASLLKILTSSRAGQVDETTANGGDGLSFFAFGPDAEEGSRLYLGFGETLPAEVELALALVLYEGYPATRGAHGEEPPAIVPSARVEWEAFSDGDWLPLEILGDETRMLSLPGRLRFRLASPLQAVELPPAEGELFWLRATVVEPGYELPPRLTAVRWQTVPAVEGETLCEALELAVDGRRIVPVPDPSYLVLHGENLVQVQGTAGFWRDLDKAVVKTGGGDGVRIDLGREPTEGEGQVRLISSPTGFRRRLLLGRGNGLPDRSFDLEASPVAELRLQVREDGRRWRDWERVDDFAASGPSSPHFRLDPETGVVRFGDGLQGRPLPAPSEEDAEDNLRILALRTGGGRTGNVERGVDAALAGPLPGGDSLSVSLPAAASGGADRETLEEARVRLRRDKLTLWRAVTDSDFEALAKATPGLRVARAWSLSGLAPAAPTAVVVIVVPFSEAAKPVPSSGFLRTVLCHLDRHRLLTTRLRVVGPDYVEVGVEAGLVLQPGAGRDAVLARAAAALGLFLHPLQGGPSGEGWPFGRPVYLSEVYAALEAVAGVDGVERVALAGSGLGVSRDDRGNLRIPPTSLVFSGAHRLAVVEREGALCRVKTAPGARP